ncbi:MAG: riboflavin synthase [Planctomycetota bacterium]
MFTGIVQALGTVESLTPHDRGLALAVRAPDLPGPLEHGGSVAIAGVCLTLTETPSDGLLRFDAVQETLDKTTLGQLAVGDSVNLERALLASEPLGGHVVQGHVDGLAIVVSVQDDPADWRLRVALPEKMRGWVIAKGSVTLDGVSLTVAELFDDGFDVALIPETLEKTTLDAVQPGDAINFEADSMVKTIVTTVQRMGLNAIGDPPAPETEPITTGLLQKAGFIPAHRLD